MSEPAQTVFVVDDDASFLSSVKRLLRASGYDTQCFTSAADFLAQRPPHAGGCVVADLQMPGMDGMALQAALAQSDNPLPVVFLSGRGDIPSSVKAMRRGAEDFLVKTAPKKELLAAIERALARNVREEAYRTRRQELRLRFGKLTSRERDVLAEVLRGRLNKEIAASLDIDERSVKRHRTSLMTKLGATSVVELVQLAVEAGVGERDGVADAG